MNFILFMLKVAFEILCIIGGFMLLRYILSNGSKTMRDVLETFGLMAKAIGTAIRKVCLRYLIREKEAEEGKTHVEATVE